MRAIADDTKRNILKEQFIPDNVFLYVVKGEIRFFDGDKTYSLQAGECGVARKNNLTKFMVTDCKEGFEPVLFCFDEPFLRQFQEKHRMGQGSFKTRDILVKVSNTAMMEDFIRSLKPYHKGIMELDKAFEDLKYEELLTILLKNQPELAELFFDFRLPGKLDLEAFMNRNYKFNVSIARLAFLTGRSLSAFKRDFKTIFDEPPGHWLLKKRLHEAYWLMDKKGQKPSDIYLELGFESLSHFSVAFKKMFGLVPTAIINKE